MSNWYIGSESSGIPTKNPPSIESWRRFSEFTIPHVGPVSPDALAHVLRLMQGTVPEDAEQLGLTEDLTRLSEQVLSQYGAVALSMLDFKSTVVNRETIWSTEPLGTVGGELNYLVEDKTHQ